ncbi:MAG TPA: pyridoxamine 5'-phosphate oxidase family protein [Acidimicrobiales bacterium]|nr:pyridoxamine 5'-phosphate oxidase family protein [Acidimicrobiales bacterium]
MSVSVGLDELHQCIDACGPRAFLVTVSEGGVPHVVSVVVHREDDAMAFETGRTSRANLRARPTATLLWPPGPLDTADSLDGEYSLIVDGQADLADDGDRVTLHPSAAVLHRIAGSAGDGPGCIPVLPRD